jgi:hypothetical protein
LVGIGGHAPQQTPQHEIAKFVQPLCIHEAGPDCVG